MIYYFFYITVCLSIITYGVYIPQSVINIVDISYSLFAKNIPLIIIRFIYLQNIEILCPFPWSCMEWVSFSTQ